MKTAQELSSQINLDRYSDHFFQPVIAHHFNNRTAIWWKFFLDNSQFELFKIFGKHFNSIIFDRPLNQIGVSWIRGIILLPDNLNNNSNTIELLLYAEESLYPDSEFLPIYQFNNKNTDYLNIVKWKVVQMCHLNIKELRDWINIRYTDKFNNIENFLIKL